MLKISFEEIKEMFEQLHYSEIEEVQAGIYKALNPWKEQREFIVLSEGEDLRILSKRNLIGTMFKYKDFQTFEVEFLSDDSTYKIYINDYVIGKDMGEFTPDKPKEVTDVFYN